MSPSSPPSTYTEFVELIVDIVNLAIPLLFGCLFIYFIWKMIGAWILNPGDQAKREEGKRYLGSAILVFVLMVSAWGIVALIKQSLFG